MTRPWMLAVPAALALIVAGCAETPAPVAPVYVAPVAVAPAYTPPPVAPMTETHAAPARRGRHHRRMMRRRAAPVVSGAYSPGSSAYSAPRAGGSGVPSEQTTSGPSAAGRTPAPAQPVGNGGS